MKTKYSQYSDSELIAMLKGEKQRAEQAFTELYQRYSPMVHAYCLRVLGDRDRAEDVFQETMIKFYHNVDPERDNINVPGFMITIARNLCLNAKRDTKQTVPVEDINYFTDSNSQIENKELLGLITSSLDLLDFDYREAFVLREYDGLPYEQIAEITNTTVSNAKSRVSRAKQKIKTILAPYLKELCN